VTILEVDKVPNEEKIEGIKTLVEAGSEIVGSSTGAVIGFLLAGLEGAAVGGACAPLLTKGLIEIGNDIEKRLLSEREKIRIGGVISYATLKIREKIAAGERLRTDGFLEQPSAGFPACAEIPIISRPPVNEVIEGLLLAVQREHEEMKLPFQGNLLANFFFNPSIDRSRANLLVKISKTISFRQMCILSIFSDPYKSLIKGRYFESSAFPSADMSLNSLFQEIFDLGSQGLLYRARYEPVTKVSHLNGIMDVEVVGAGFDLYNLMELGKIEETYFDAIAFKLFPLESTKYPPKKRQNL
jgi:hypothetical protein